MFCLRLALSSFAGPGRTVHSSGCNCRTRVLVAFRRGCLGNGDFDEGTVFICTSIVHERIQRQEVAWRALAKHGAGIAFSAGVESTCGPLKREPGAKETADGSDIRRWICGKIRDWNSKLTENSTPGVTELNYDLRVREEFPVSPDSRAYGVFMV